MLKVTLLLERQTSDQSISHTTVNNVFRNYKKNESNVLKDGILKELQYDFKDLHPEAHQPKVEENNIDVIGVSMMPNANGRNVPHGDSVKIRRNPGESAEDLIDHIKPAIRQNLDIMIC